MGTTKTRFQRNLTVLTFGTEGIRRRLMAIGLCLKITESASPEQHGGGADVMRVQNTLGRYRWSLQFVRLPHYESKRQEKRQDIERGKFCEKVL
jgi:hypothetical protein